MGRMFSLNMKGRIGDCPLDSIHWKTGKNRHGNFNLESFGSLRRRGGVRQLQKEKFPKGKS